MRKKAQIDSLIPPIGSAASGCPTRQSSPARSLLLARRSAALWRRRRRRKDRPAARPRDDRASTLGHLPPHLCRPEQAEDRLLEDRRQSAAVQRERPRCCATARASSGSARWRGPTAEYGWQGRPHDFIGFDEGAQLAEEKVRFVMGWRRSSTPGQRCRVVIASNPPIGGQGAMAVDVVRAMARSRRFPIPPRRANCAGAACARTGSIAWVDGPGTHLIDGMPLQALSCTFIPARLERQQLPARHRISRAADEPAGAAALEAAARRFPRRARGCAQPGHPFGLDRGSRRSAGRRTAARA